MAEKTSSRTKAFGAAQTGMRQNERSGAKAAGRCQGILSQERATRRNPRCRTAGFWQAARSSNPTGFQRKGRGAPDDRPDSPPHDDPHPIRIRKSLSATSLLSSGRVTDLSPRAVNLRRWICTKGAFKKPFVKREPITAPGTDAPFYLVSRKDKANCALEPLRGWALDRRLPSRTHRK